MAADTLALLRRLARGVREHRFPSTRRRRRSRLLDRLLELQEFDAFESLAVVWNTSPLPERDRRELLAGVYMARGFLDSAAEEWLAVAASEPTGPALAGLARVAHARGLADDARVCSNEALRLDPVERRRGERCRDVLAPGAPTQARQKPVLPGQRLKVSGRCRLRTRHPFLDPRKDR